MKQRKPTGKRQEKIKVTLEKPLPHELLPLDRSWRQFLEENALSVYKTSKPFLHKVIATLYHWVETDKPIHLGQFCAKYKFSYFTLMEMQRDYPEIQEALKDVRYILGANRFVGAAEGKYSREIVLRDMHHYDPDWDKVNKYWHAMNMERIAARQENNQPTTLQVIMEPAPRIDHVPQAQEVKQETEQS